MILYGLKTCDTCRNAIKSLDDVEVRDIRADGVPDRVLADALARFGDALINRRSATWRGLSAEDRARDPLDLLRAQPTLMKRPLIVDGARMHLGWGPDVRAQLPG